MYAIVDIAGQQFKVESGQCIYVHRLAKKEGEKVTFEKVLLTENEGVIKVGTPEVAGASVSATVLSHVRGDKVKVFKKKRRKGYQKLNGHRQDLSYIKIEDILLSGKKVEKKESEKKVAPKKTATSQNSGKGDDLTKIEGIGPKSASLLNEAGIATFESLSKMDADKISEILVAGGGNAYNRFDTSTWAKQAALAAENKWEELKKYQEELNGGKEK